MKGPRVLVAGIGNVFMGDDAFGVAVVHRLLHRPLPEGVVVMDAGIRGLDLTYALMDDYDAAVLVDATRRGREPGTLYLLEPEESPPGGDQATLLDAHGMDPARVLAFVRASGAKLRLLRVVGCEPLVLGSDEEPEFGLSAPVAAAVGPAVELVRTVLADLAVAHEDALAEGRAAGPHA